jgi:hypothetical protein
MRNLKNKILANFYFLVIINTGVNYKYGLFILLIMAEGPNFAEILSAQQASQSMVGSSQQQAGQAFSHVENFLSSHSDFSKLGFVTLFEHIDKLLSGSGSLNDIKSLLDSGLKRFFGDIKGVPELEADYSVKLGAQQSLAEAQVKGVIGDFTPKQGGH